MRSFTPVELARMQGTQDAAMMDACVLEAYGASTSNYGYGHSYSDVSTSVCGLKPAPSREVMESGQVALPDARLRLPIHTGVAGVDRVRVTHRHGVALAVPLVYDVIGLPERGPSGLQLNLRLATGGEPSAPLPWGDYGLAFSDANNSMYLALF